MKIVVSWSRVAGLLALACACSASDGSSGGRSASSTGGAPGSEGGAATPPFAVGGLGGSSIGPLPAPEPVAPTPSGAEALCDGKDDDGNGIIDDVDVAGDGICDCLTVATLGSAGLAGTGSVFSSWLSARSTNGAAALGDAVLTAAVLEPFQVLIAQDLSLLHAYSPAEVQALGDWVAAGGGLMTMIGYGGPTEVINVNTLLAPFGLSYGTTDIMQAGWTGIPGLSPRVSASVVEWQPHALSFGVLAVGMDNGKPVLGSGQVVATGQGHVLGMTDEHGLGKVFAWADEWITFDSEWVGRPEFQVELFWINILGFLTPTTECQVPVPPELIIQ